mmetsp:Transcript_41220/g.103915  ORF Transcript_41220/g.103915 Transcript_41220/m.103915 type:complete len:280 (+) Transcript_41220:202-1041(+)
MALSFSIFARAASICSLTCCCSDTTASCFADTSSFCLARSASSGACSFCTRRTTASCVILAFLRGSGSSCSRACSCTLALLRCTAEVLASSESARRRSHSPLYFCSSAANASAASCCAFSSALRSATVLSSSAFLARSSSSARLRLSSACASFSMDACAASISRCSASVKEPWGAVAHWLGVFFFFQMRYSRSAILPLLSVSMARSASFLAVCVMGSSLSSRNLALQNWSSSFPAAPLGSVDILSSLMNSFTHFHTMLAKSGSAPSFQNPLRNQMACSL